MPRVAVDGRRQSRRVEWCSRLRWPRTRARRRAARKRGTAALRDLARHRHHAGGTAAARHRARRTRDDALASARRRCMTATLRACPGRCCASDRDILRSLAGASRRYASETLSVARWREDGSGQRSLRVLLIVEPDRGPARRGRRRHALAALADGARRHLRPPRKRRGYARANPRGARRRPPTTSCISRVTPSSIRTTRSQWARVPRRGDSARRPISTVSVTCRHSCSAMRAKPHECAGRRARARHASRLQPGNPVCAARQALPKLSSAAGSRISSARTGRSKTPPRSRFRAPSTMRLLLAPRWEMPCSARAARWRHCAPIDWADYVHYGSPDFRLTLHRPASATSG